MEKGEERRREWIGKKREGRRGGGRERRVKDGVERNGWRMRRDEWIGDVVQEIVERRR